jgi:hypothetical protein
VNGLSARWSLAGLDDADQLAKKLRDYVVEQSLERFNGKPGLRFKTWRMRSGEWFEGTYVFVDAASRDAFAEEFTAAAADAAVSRLLGRAPELIEPFEVVAVAEGAAGFLAGPGPGADDR